MRKQAAELTDEQKREMMMNILIGAGGGAGVGALTQYLLTGKAGLMGAGLGAAGGAAVGAGIDDNARAKIKEFFTGGGKKPPEAAPETTDTPEGTTPEVKPEEGAETASDEKRVLTPDERREYYNYLKDNMGKMDEANQAHASKVMQDIAAYESMEAAPKNWEVLRNAEDKEVAGSLANIAVGYTMDYMNKNGTAPGDNDLGKFLFAVKEGELDVTQPKEVDEWLAGMHDYQIKDKDNLAVTALGSADTLAAATTTQALRNRFGEAGKLGVKQALDKVKDKGVKESMRLLLRGPATAGATTAAPKGPGVISKAWTATKAIPGGAKAKGAQALHLLNTPITKETLKGAGRQLLTKGGGAAMGAGKTAWNIGRSFVSPNFLAANVILDAPSLYVDPETGKINYWNWWENVDKQEKLMSLREQKRGMLKNTVMGGLRGLVTPWTTAPVAIDRAAKTRQIVEDVTDESGPAAGRRVLKDTLITFVPGLHNYQFKPTREENLATELRQYYIHNKGKKSKMADTGEEFRIADRYDPRRFARLTKQGYVPVILPNGKFGYKSPRGGMIGTIIQSEAQKRQAERDRKAIMGGGPNAPKEKIMEKAPTWAELNRRRLIRQGKLGTYGPL